MAEILETIRSAFTQAGNGLVLLGDIWACFPDAIQELVFIFFVFVFGSAAILLILKILR